MELLPNGSDKHEPLVPYEAPLYVDNPKQAYYAPEGGAEELAARVDVRALVRKYWLLALALLILGAGAGFASVVLSSPRYQAQLLLEVQSTGSTLKNGIGSDGGDVTEVGIQTQINILRSGTFLKRGAERMNQDTVPLAPTGTDIFSRLRQRIHPAIQDPLENARQGLTVAMTTFDAKPVNRTRLIQLSCESSSPEVAAQFLNSMAAEYVEDSTRSRMQAAQKTSEWLAASIEQTKAEMQEAEEHLRDYSAASGNIFAGQDAALTLEDTKLGNLKGDLAKIQADRIAKQTRYELTLKYPPEALGEVLDDNVLRGYQQKIATLEEQKAVLEVRYTPKAEKVRELDAQLASVRKDYQNEIRSVTTRMKDDYEAAARQEKLLNDTYNAQAQRVGSQAAKTSQYNSLKREAETLHQVYQSLLIQQSEAGLNSSVPVNPIRIVEAASPPAFPFKPSPILNISFGCLLGAVLAGGLAFLRERTDHSIRTPGASRRLFNVPELGVIPSLGTNGNGLSINPVKALRNGHASESATALSNWQTGPSFITESFRGTLTSILRNQTSGRNQKLVLITSPGPSEGKTTVLQNLGIALAETGRRVLLVDADFRRPNLHHKFGLPNEWGMTDLLQEDTPPSEYRADRLGVATGVPGLSLLANGSTMPVAEISRTLYLPRLRGIFQTLARHYDMVLVDAPPILHVADTRIIAPLTDALILVLRSGVTDRASALEAYERIQEDGLTLLGTVLTDYVSSSRKKHYYYDYGNPR